MIEELAVGLVVAEHARLFGRYCLKRGGSTRWANWLLGCHRGHERGPWRRGGPYVR